MGLLIGLNGVRDDLGFVPGALEVDGAINHDGSTAGFLGATPVARAAAIAALTNNMEDTTVNGVLEAMTGLGTVTVATVARNMSELNAKINALRQVLIDFGFLTA